MSDRTFHQLTLFYVLNSFQPGIRLKLADRKADALAIVIYIYDFDLDFLTNLEDLLRMIHMLPREFRQMHQTIRTLNIDESAKIGQAGDASRTDIALLQLIQKAFLKSLAGFLQGGAFR